MGIPLHVFEEIVSLAREMETVKDGDRSENLRDPISRYNEIRYRLKEIERAYTFDSDQEEQMI